MRALKASERSKKNSRMRWILAENEDQSKQALAGVSDMYTVKDSLHTVIEVKMTKNVFQTCKMQLYNCRMPSNMRLQINHHE